MSYIVGPNLSPSLPLVAQQPLRGVWRRSATAVAKVVLSAGLVDADLQTLYQQLEEQLVGAFVVRSSPPTFTADTVTIDLVVLSKVPTGFTGSALAVKLDDLVTGLPLVSLDGRVRVAGESERASSRDVTAQAGQAAAEQQGVGNVLSGLAGKLGMIGAGVVILAVVVAAFYFLPKRPAGKGGA